MQSTQKKTNKLRTAKKKNTRINCKKSKMQKALEMPKNLEKQTPKIAKS